jgi:FkbM family methyltransferase
VLGQAALAVIGFQGASMNWGDRIVAPLVRDCRVRTSQRETAIMGYKNTLLSLANRLVVAGLFFNRKLPTYYQGHWIWLSRASWESLFSRYEPSIGRAIKNHLTAGDTFWDIGANMGWFSLLAAKIVGPNGRVFSFEPSPDVFNLLSDNARGLDSIRAIQCGVGNADTIAVFSAQGASTSASFVEEVTKINQHNLPEIQIRKVAVNIRKVDTLVKELGLPQLVKIDVEGFEFEVLKGAAVLLSNAQPTLILEIHPPQLNLTGGSETSLFQFLKEHGYGWEVIDRNPNSLYSIIAQPT